MLTRILIKNFKRFDEVDIELGKTVVLIGPNNSGKTTALQALALWGLGLRRWLEKRGEGTELASERLRPGVTLNRRDLIAIPVPSANLLWRDLHVRRGQPNQNIRIDIIVEGISGGKPWQCGLEFDYANEESLYCRPLRLSEDKRPERMPIPTESYQVQTAFLPPMSGLAAVEPKWEPGKINVLLGEGQTAQVLRNLCFQLYEKSQFWSLVTAQIQKLFGVTLNPPCHLQARGEITMTYQESGGPKLDLASAGRGLQQTLLLLAYLYTNPQMVLLIDEPDAHLEVLRQRQIYQLLTEVALTQGAQVIAASHSEIVLNEAAERDIVIALVGKPHRIDRRGSHQVMKSLTELGFEQYYQAEQTGWILYLEGSTDLAILRAFAATLEHPVSKYLERPFIHYVTTNLPDRARTHFFGLREAKEDLMGVALFDKLNKPLQKHPQLIEMMWQRREIENYLCQEEVLLAYARQADDDLSDDDLFYKSVTERREQKMQEAITEVASALKILRKLEPWSPEIKASDDFLEPLFDEYFKKLDLGNVMRKTNYHVLAKLVPKDRIDPEVIDKLDLILKVATQARPRQN